MLRISLVACAALIALSPGIAVAEGDADAGETKFKRCQACHALEEGKNKVGPTLHGLFGRTAGTVEGYRYSDDLVEAGEQGLVWNEETLFGYLEDPGEYLEELLGKDRVNNKMRNKFKDEELRQDIIAYLREATK